MNSKLNILFAEDDIVSNESLSFLMKAMNVVGNVESCSNGYEALEKFKQNSNYDLIISDIRMPLLSGIDFINEAKKINNEIDVILLTAHNEVEYLHHAIDLSVTKYLLKPLDVIELKEQLEILHEKKILLIKNKEKEKTNIINIRKEAIDEAIFNISHQWRQPLNLIALEVSHLQLAKTLDKLNEEDVDYTLKNILETANKLSQTITNFENIENVEKYSTKEFINLKTLFLHELEFFNPLFTQYNINVSIDIENSLFCELYQKEFLSVINDIILNSIEQFSHIKTDKPEIKIFAKKDDEATTLEISDNAGGINSEILPKIFEPYFTTKFSSEDKGLGLYLSQKIITNKFNGTIKAINKNNGATFTIKIPN